MVEKKLPVFFRYRIWWHILFWIVTFIMYWLVYAGYEGQYKQEFTMNLTVLPARLIGTYTLIYLILPLATKQKKFITFGIFVLIHFVLYGFLIYASYYYINPVPNYYDFSDLPLFNISKILIKSISDYAIPAMGSALVIFKKWYIDDRTKRKLENEKQEAELKFLKSQIHPHFLFNTLNNLYALTLIKSDKTPDIVLKLSGLLDYMLYNSNEDFVPLEKEIEILESYIELEKIRYDNRLDLKYDVQGSVKGKHIAPLILLPFIENSFKHGASNDRTKPKIEILLQVEQHYLQLRVFNSTPSETKEDASVSEGIGLKNVKRRLDLIYKKKYFLEILNEQNNYEVQLQINLQNRQR